MEPNISYGDYRNTDDTLILLSEGVDEIIATWPVDNPTWLCAASELGDLESFRKLAPHIPDLDYLRFHDTDHPLALSMKYNHTEFTRHFMDPEKTPFRIQSLAFAIKWSHIHNSPLFDELLALYIKMLPNEEENFICEDLGLFIEALARKKSSSVLKFKSLFDDPPTVKELMIKDDLMVYLNEVFGQ
jgi:hypothetical protein